jgi:hypothetical protein
VDEKAVYYKGFSPHSYFLFLYIKSFGLKSGKRGAFCITALKDGANGLINGFIS